MVLILSAPFQTCNPCGCRGGFGLETKETTEELIPSRVDVTHQTSKTFSFGESPISIFFDHPGTGTDSSKVLDELIRLQSSMTELTDEVFPF